jgi:hypothetical protein
MWERITRFSAITLIALMFWIYAEGATRALHEVTLNIVLAAPEGQRLVIDPSLLSVNLSIRCARSQLEQVNKLKQEPLRIEVTDVAGMPDRTFFIKEQIIAHERIVRLGVTVERVEPALVSTRIERLEPSVLPIVLATPPDLELAGPATFGTEAVQVIVPASAAAAVKGLKFPARLDANALAGVVPGVPTDREIDVYLPPEMATMPNVSYQPKKVKVNFTVKKKEDDYIVGLVPVLLNIAPNLAKQYAVEVDQENLLLRDVKVKGPSDVIERIRTGSVKVEALLRMTPEDLERKVPSKLPELRLPGGVTVESTLPLIKLTITKREPTG